MCEHDNMGLGKTITVMDTIGPCKNAAVYRTILLADSGGREVL
jgi:hypothetical protein